MSRAPMKNGAASAALAQGGYDAYFAQLDDSAGEAPPTGASSGAASAASTAGPTESAVTPETGADQMSSAQPPEPATPQQTANAQVSVSPSAPPPIGQQTPAAPQDTTDADLAELRQRAVTAHERAAEEERQTIERRQQEAQAANAMPPAAVPPAQPHPPAAPPPAQPAQPTGAAWVAPHGDAGPVHGAYGQGPAQGAPPPGYHTGAGHSTAAGGFAQHAPRPGGGASASASGPAATDNSRVPDRIYRPESTGRIEVLPPALASAELLADIAAVRQAHLRSNKGMRGALNKVGFNLGLSPAEQQAEQRRTRIRRQLTAPYQIAVVSVKGGVGRTTTAAGLGSTFAKLRPDRVVAIDANPDFGDLSSRTTRHQFGLTLRDLAQAGATLDTFSAVHSYTSVNTADLAVVASPWNTDAAEALTGTEYQQGVDILRRHYNLLVVDCGTGVLDSSTNTVLHTSNAVVVVTPATVGGVTGAVATLNWLNSHGFDHLIANSVIAIVRQHPVKPTVDVDAIEKLFASAQRPTIQIPFDPHLAEGGEIDLRMLDKDAALAFEDLAAGLADDFPGYLAEPSGGEYGGMR